MKINIIKVSVFTLISELLDSAGGDGGVVLVCENYREISDEFEKWLNENKPNHLKRLDCEKWVDFNREQGDIWITNHNNDTDFGYLQGKIMINMWGAES